MSHVPQEVADRITLTVLRRHYPDVVVDVPAWHARWIDRSQGKMISSPRENWLLFLMPGQDPKCPADIVEGLLDLSGLPLHEPIRAAIQGILSAAEAFAVSMHNAAMWGEVPIILHLLELRGSATASFVEVNITEHSRTLGETHSGPTDNIWLT